MLAMYEFLVMLRDHLKVNVMHYDYIGYGLAKGMFLKKKNVHAVKIKDNQMKQIHMRVLKLHMII